MTALEDRTIHYIVYGPDGAIRQSGDCALSLLPHYAPIYGQGFKAIEVPADQYRRDIDAHCYVLDGVITAKGTALDVSEYTVNADGVDAVRFAVPAGTSVLHAGEIVAIEDNAFEFTTDVLGDHRFSFIAPAAFHHFEVTIHAA
ncbi:MULTISPECIES: hypothetical protein [unclassified Rhizobium]|uniref:hypothetical protein n=1 Tax=unclassified Rhizobium TaxID=2613769 RepID=UPI000CDF497A|nr:MULTISPECIES: hypothetical protein [Rhizobium]AVA22178.1 hypothetical protein NXC24_CH02543 [Rhizobium sp. NXC24]UWU19626.1 hypothetical protein N2601_09890 [Rhizobium tropici]